ncbi:hypothetical protein VTK73DRAFT_10078 [Phialemonium thermophilum]|uniref:Apc15p protein-domain-containing protein n=1 Tax=Phialemonium thermophilum TaxID=223376 RepID=A0ABR3XIC3_9PEZI
MLSLLPDLTPRDSHSLWYTPSRNPGRRPAHLDPAFSNQENGGPSGSLSHTGSGGQGFTTRGARSSHTSSGPAAAAATAQATVERSTLARLRADEAHAERRRSNVANFGATWLKPPGVSKTLFQMREERREQEEHAEAMRREQLAQELAEAEAEAAGAAAAAALAAEEGQPIGAEGGILNTDRGIGGVGSTDLMDEDMMGGERDLDDEIPDADDDGFGYGEMTDDEDEDEDEEDEDEDEDEEDAGVDAYGSNAQDEEPEPGAARQRRTQQRELANRMATVREAEDRARERIVRREDINLDMYEEGEDLEGEQQDQMLEEEDLTRFPVHYEQVVEPGMDMDMQANLDDDVPEAESGGYEHTDTEAELTSSDDASVDEESADWQGHGSAHAAQETVVSQFSSSRTQRGAVRTDVDIGSVLSQDDSSVMDSNPQVRHRS